MGVGLQDTREQMNLISVMTSGSYPLRRIRSQSTREEFAAVVPALLADEAVDLARVAREVLRRSGSQVLKSDLSLFSYSRGGVVED